MPDHARIVHITSAHPPFDVRIFIKMCRSLAKEGYDVHLIAPRSHCSGIETKDGVVIHPVPVGHDRRSRMTVTSKQAVKMALSLGGQLYHFHDPEMLRFALGIQRKTGAPVVYDAHEDVRLQILEKSWLPGESRKLISWAFGHYEDYIVKRLAGVVCATPSIAERFSWHPTCEIIHNYPIMTELHPNRESTVIAEKYLVYAGAISPGRGIMESIEAMRLVKAPVKFYIAGPNSPHTDCLETPSTKYLGQLSRSELRDLLGNAMAGLVLFSPLPNHINAQPNKLFEYMSAGIPVIASHFPLWRKIIKSINCGLVVDPESPREIAEAIDYLAEHPQEAKSMGMRGRLAVEKQYNWESEEKKLFQFYDRLLALGGLQDSEALAEATK